MRKVEVNGFSAEVTHYTPHVRMVYRAIARKMHILIEELAKAHGADPEDMDMAVADYAMLCARVRNFSSTGKKPLDFGFVQAGDDLDTMRREFEAYFYTKHFAFVQSLELAANALDMPLTEPEQQPVMETNDPND